jgi:hypothetical protein
VIGSVRRIKPTALKWNGKLPKVISSPLLKEARDDRSASGCGLWATDPKQINSLSTDGL